VDIATPPTNNPLDERIAVVRGFMDLAWRGRRTILISVLTTTLLGLAAAFLPARVYKATVTMSPAAQAEPGSGLSALLGQLGDADSLLPMAGLVRGDRQALAILRSRTFVEAFIRDNALLPVLFARQWDAEHQRWNTSKPPTMDDAWELFDKRVRLLVQDQKTGIVSLSIKWPDRQLAANWANELADRINVEMRRRVNAEADASLAILDQELPKISAVELRQVVFKLTEAEIRRKILANSKPDFAFAIIDRATVPDEKRFDSPKRGLIILFAVITGLVIGITWATIRSTSTAHRGAT
jgi:LPS O-antigen subunit length determinant protein (WzzB/FepE family)